MALTARQQFFVDEYLQCFNATEAARRANYAHPNKDGPRLLVNVGISEVISRYFAEKAMGRDETLGRLADHARGSIEDVLTIRTVRRQAMVVKPLADVIADLKAEMLFEEEYATRAGFSDDERARHDANMASIERKILRYEMRLDRDLDAMEEVAGPIVEEQIADVDLVEAKRKGKLHLVKSYNAKDGKVELYDAQAALGLIGKHHGLFLDKVALTDPTGTKEYADSTLDTLRQRLIAQVTASASGATASGVPDVTQSARDEGAAV